MKKIERILYSSRLYEKDDIIQIIKNDSRDNGNLISFMNYFINGYSQRKKNNQKVGVSMETAFKKFLYRKNEK